jgi:TrmH family RNA methyltransferase
VVEARALDELADTEHPQGVIAVIEPRAWTLEDIPVGKGSVVLVLDAVQDPGNVGTIIRTALALGADGVIALKGTADLTNPKVLRGSMGALFRLPSVAASQADLLGWSRAAGVNLLVAAGDGAPASGWTNRTEGPIALVLGNEGAGVGGAIAAEAAGRVGIPLRPGADSLNVAVAAGILLYEVRRER